jgi:prevent-host-death family protein
MFYVCVDPEDDYDCRRSSVKRMAAGSLKVHCLAVMDEVQAKRKSVVITKHGEPVAKLVPADKNIDDIYDFLAGKGTITGDVVAPVLSENDSGRHASCRLAGV